MSKKWLTPDEIERKQQERLARERARMIEGARHYAAFDRTDPFTLARAMAHIDSGVAAYRRDAGRESGFPVDAGDAFYKATPYREEQEMMSYDGRKTTYAVMRYMNVVRP